MHPEDIKAAIRKKHGSCSAFEQANKLPRDSVSNMLRGRGSERVAKAIATALDKPLGIVFPDYIVRVPARELVHRTPHEPGHAETAQGGGR